MSPRSTLGSPLNDIPDELWEIGKAREKIVRELVLNPPPFGARVEAMQAAAAELGITVKQLYQVIRQYKADPRTRSVVPQTGGRPAGLRFLDPRVEEIIEAEVRTSFLALLKPKKAQLVRDIRARCAQEGLPLPSRDSIELRLSKISKREQTKHRLGKKAAKDKYDLIRGSLEADYPLHIVQIDHTPMDIHAVEEDTRELIGRPKISLAVDVRTRMYCGFYLTFDPPGAASVAACIAHSIMDKSDWLAARGLPPCWPVMGLFDVLHVDNGKEFHSRALSRACEDYGIEIRYRLPRTPHLGGHVERRIGHLSQEIHRLPGTTFSNVKERGIYDSEGNA